jgi:hypothetical protein
MLLPSSSSLASDDGEEDGRHHHPEGVGRGASDRVREASVLGTGRGCTGEFSSAKAKKKYWFHVH